jgi:tetratricopeptide (TPR) repeat protein
MRRSLFFVLFALFTMPAAAATVQQDFDAAQAKLDAQDYAGARDAFTALLERFPQGSTGKAASLVRARLGNALIATNDPDAAVPMLEAALPGLKPTTPAEAELAALARFDLGRAEEALGALDLAARQYRTALDLKAFSPDSPTDIGLRASLARTLIWSDPAEARRLLDALLALPPANLKGDSRALVMTLRGRVELNNGNPAEARRWFNNAATAAGGGATVNVTVADVRIRGDLALAHILTGNTVEAQRFVALSGAGQLLAQGLAIASERPLPSCAPASGIAPDAVAVVEFGIADDGRSYAVTPIYASRGSGTPSGDDRTEIAFVQAVRNWSWTPDQMTELDPFWRQAVRVEMRCQMPRNESDAVTDSFTAELRAWQDAQGILPNPAYQGSDASLLPKVRAELARREAEYGPTSPQLLPALAAVSSNVAAPYKERMAAWSRIGPILVASKAPPSVIMMHRISDIGRPVEIRDVPAAQKDMHAAFAALLNDMNKTGMGNSRAAMLVRLRLAELDEDMKDATGARTQLEMIAGAPESQLPADDPIRIAALLRISNQAAAARDTVTAASALAATGLAPEQCALIDVQPQPINRSIGSREFPNEARWWSSEGFVMIAHDITADGATTNVRTLLALPPFAFSQVTEKAVARFRFQPVFRPGNSIGCAGATQSVRFMIAPDPRKKSSKDKT